MSRRLSLRSLLLAPALALTLTQCVDLDEPVKDLIPPCTSGEAARTVTDARTSADLLLTWSPKCRVSHLTVVDAEAVEAVWDVRTRWYDDHGVPPNPLGPPVLYGDRPETIIERVASRTLVVGKKYKVFVWAIDPAKPDVEFQVGTGEFTR